MEPENGNEHDRYAVSVKKNDNRPTCTSDGLSYLWFFLNHRGSMMRCHVSMLGVINATPRSLFHTGRLFGTGRLFLYVGLLTGHLSGQRHLFEPGVYMVKYGTCGTSLNTNLSWGSVEVNPRPNSGLFAVIQYTLYEK